MEWLWIAVAIAALVIELTTKRLVAVWVALSALIVNLVDGVFNVGLLWQGAIFIGMSVLLILVTYPLTKKLLRKENDKNSEKCEENQKSE